MPAWRAATHRAVVAGLESQLRRALAEHGGLLLEKGATLADLGVDAEETLSVAVDGWLDELTRKTAVDSHPRLALVTLVNAVVASVDPAVSELVLGEGHEARVAEAMDMLAARVAVVQAHYGDRLAEAWRLLTGEPGGEDLRSTLTTVAAAYQFADA